MYYVHTIRKSSRCLSVAKDLRTTFSSLIVGKHEKATDFTRRRSSTEKGRKRNKYCYCTQEKALFLPFFCFVVRRYCTILCRFRRSRVLFCSLEPVDKQGDRGGINFQTEGGGGGGGGALLAAVGAVEVVLVLIDCSLGGGVVQSLQWPQNRHHQQTGCYCTQPACNLELCDWIRVSCPRTLALLTCGLPEEAVPKNLHPQCGRQRNVAGRVPTAQS